MTCLKASPVAVAMPILAGDAMHTYALCEVIESASAKFAVGDIVAAETVWADYAVVPAKGTLKLPKVAQLSHLLSVFGVAGKTAFHGLMSVGLPVPGETVVVSAAAGSVDEAAAARMMALMIELGGAELVGDMTEMPSGIFLQPRN